MVDHPTGSPPTDGHSGAAVDGNAEEAIRQATLRSRAIAASLGAVVSVLMRSKEHRHIPVGDIEALIGPAIATDQFAIAEGRDPKNGIVAPIAFVTWATVSAEVDKRLADISARTQPLTVADWRSGDIPWIITAAGDKRAASALVEQLIRAKFSGRPARFRTRDEHGQTKIGEVALGDRAIAEA